MQPIVLAHAQHLSMGVWAPMHCTPNHHQLDAKSDLQAEALLRCKHVSVQCEILWIFYHGADIQLYSHPVCHKLWQSLSGLHVSFAHQGFPILQQDPALHPLLFKPARLALMRTCLVADAQTNARATSCPCLHGLWPTSKCMSVCQGIHGK